MTPRQVVNFFGGVQVKAAKAIKVKQSTIASWVARGYVPYGTQCEIQLLTGGALRADPASVPAKKHSAPKKPVCPYSQDPGDKGSLSTEPAGSAMDRTV